MASDPEIDDSLYSRQRYVLGDSAMKRMASSSVLIYGLGGLGIEIAKNIVLAGVKSLTIQGNRLVSVADLGTQFFVKESDIAHLRSRVEASESKLMELNPYVSIQKIVTGLDMNTDLNYLKKYQCVILTEVSLDLQIKVDKFCRTQDPPIQFIAADVLGLAGSVFCDFGDKFEVLDPNGEEPRDFFIENITKDNPGVVTCLRDRFHGLETGDTVRFREISGMTALNDKLCQVKVISPSSFSVCDTTGEVFESYLHGGIVTPVKVPVTQSFESLENQIKHPRLLVPDLCRMHAPQNLHLGMLALNQFRLEEKGQLPNIWCQKDACRLVAIAKNINSTMSMPIENVDEDIIKGLAYTCRGCFAPLCAVLGGFVAQESLKALTGKFTPLNQWLYLDSIDMVKHCELTSPAFFQPRGDRYDPLRICIGDDKCQKLARLKLFMVGCGAIGCEMLKNYALLGVASNSEGHITITDNDLIEKSNLNRQFLFRPHHIRKPKSTTAAQAAREINSRLRIEAQQHKVCPQTESSNYDDAFFERQNVIVNALDNVEARRYVDSRCVTNQRALLESGTMGTKGHVQVIVPHITESYSSQRDPVDEDVPYCTLKSFPAQIEHCIQWARDKFESSFSIKPALYNKFLKNNGSIAEAVEKLRSGVCIENAQQIARILHSKPVDWYDCVLLARMKFEKYFNHKAKNLLHHFPLDTKLKDGSLFWQSPKRPPVPIVFDLQNPLHLAFIISTARLYADVNKIPKSSQEPTAFVCQEILKDVKLPPYKPSSKAIITDESAGKPAGEAAGDEEEAAVQIQTAVKVSRDQKQLLSMMTAAEFEKDDDSNAHIDFITAAANLRASMYNIENSDRLKVKKIAGRIVPAIATTTAAVAGLVSIELVKLLDELPIESYRNCFLNLALPVIVLSEPGPAQKETIKEGLTVTMWDRWVVQGNKNFTLQQFLQYFKDNYGFEATMVGHGVKMVYMPFMPGHNKRLPQTMVKLLKPSPQQLYMDLVVSLEGDQQEDIPGPPVRYYFGL